MYKSGIIAAAPATETLAGPDKPGQIIEPRRNGMRRSKGPFAMVARDLMTSPAVVAESGAAVHEVARLMLQEGVSAVPVINDSGVAIGMASDGDLLGRRPYDNRRAWWLSFLADRVALGDVFGPYGERSVLDVMSAPLISISTGAPVQDIAETLQVHGIKRLPVIEDGKVLGIVSRADLLHVVQMIPRTRVEEESGAGLLSFLESMIGGTSLRGVAERSRAQDKSPQVETRAAPSALSAKEFRDAVRAYKAESQDHTQAFKREAQLKREQEIRALLDQRVSGDQWNKMLDQAKLAARSGEQEFLMLRFPSDLCSDGGRKIDVAEQGWEGTLRGEAADLYSRWRMELKPQGFGLSARIVSYEEGIIGDIALYLTWEGD
jgi:CBS domain-containing protein